MVIVYLLGIIVCIFILKKVWDLYWLIKITNHIKDKDE